MADCPPQADGTLTATGTNTNADFLTALTGARDDVKVKLAKAEVTWSQANACPKGCSFPDTWTDKAVFTVAPTSGTSQRLAPTFELLYTATIDVTQGIHRVCYKTEQAVKDGKAARAQAEEDARKAAKKAAEPPPKPPKKDKAAIKKATKAKKAAKKTAKKKG